MLYFEYTEAETMAKRHHRLSAVVLVRAPGSLTHVVLQHARVVHEACGVGRVRHPSEPVCVRAIVRVRVRVRL